MIPVRGPGHEGGPRWESVAGSNGGTAVRFDLAHGWRVRGRTGVRRADESGG